MSRDCTPFDMSVFPIGTSNWSLALLYYPALSQDIRDSIFAIPSCSLLKAKVILDPVHCQIAAAKALADVVSPITRMYSTQEAFIAAAAAADHGRSGRLRIQATVDDAAVLVCILSPTETTANVVTHSIVYCILCSCVLLG